MVQNEVVPQREDAIQDSQAIQRHVTEWKLKNTLSISN
jgi:hypothetical protein